jgi:ABC-type Zn uptake system ZnuABC Zn-binding protein ZnuA
MDPSRYKKQAYNVTEGLARFRPENGELLRVRYQTLARELDALDATLIKRGAALKGATVLTTDDRYRYFAARAGLSLQTVALDAEPSPEQLAQIAELVDSATGPTLMWWPAPVSDAMRTALPGGLQHQVIDPLDQAPAGGSYDYLRQVRANFKALQAQASSPVPSSGQ